MKRLLLFLLLFPVIVQAQRISRITLAGQGSQNTVTFLLNEDVVIHLTQNGAIESWGVDFYAERNNDYIPRPLRPYNGRTENYTQYDNEAFRGKIKYIGGTLITYYASFDEKHLVGKVKSIGPIAIQYNSIYDDPSSEGKIKKVGQLAFSYYSAFDNTAFQGKLRSTGSVNITYYSSMDDKLISGKIKSLNGVPFTYYTSMDQVNLRGAMRSGNLIQNINGITYIIRN